MYRNRKTGKIGIILTIVVLIVIVVLSNIESNKVPHIGNIFSNIVMPIQNGFTYLKNKIEGNDSFFTDVKNLKQENEELKQKNKTLEQSLKELEIIKSENETLKEYVNLKDKYLEYKTVPAYIISKNINNYEKTVVINLGQKDGIKPNMTVISSEGLVGYILSVTQNTAKVQTIIDVSTSVSSAISTSRDAIIVNGTLGSNNILKASYIPTEATLLENDSVETSGIGGIYPKGIHIGTIKEIIDTKNNIDRYAYIETAVDFSKLETVLVITN